MLLKNQFTLFLCLIIGYAAFAQTEKSNIYLFDIKQDQEDNSKISFVNPKYLTAFNAEGYNSTPSFFTNNELYISVRFPTAAQTDIYKLDLESETKQQVTATAESEFAPIRMPEYYTFSAIREEKDGREDVLRLWQFPVDQLTNGKLIFKYITGIEEYMWLNSREVVVYKDESPSTLSIINTNNDEISTIATGVGTNFVRMPNGNLAYVQKSKYEDWKIMEKNLYRRREAPRTIIETLPNAECFTILPDGTFIMAKGSKLYRYNKITDDNWKEMADFRFYEIRNISRLVVSPDFKIAIVAD